MWDLTPLLLLTPDSSYSAYSCREMWYCSKWVTSYIYRRFLNSLSKLFKTAFSFYSIFTSILIHVLDWVKYSKNKSPKISTCITRYLCKALTDTPLWYWVLTSLWFGRLKQRRRFPRRVRWVPMVCNKKQEPLDQWWGWTVLCPWEKSIRPLERTPCHRLHSIVPDLNFTLLASTAESWSRFDWSDPG